MKAADRLSYLRDNPVEFVRWAFKVEPDAWQAEALRSIAGPGIHRLSLKACAGPGKSALGAWVVWYFLSLYARAGHLPKGICLSITRENLTANLWAEIHKWRGRSDWLRDQFDINTDKIFQKDHPAEWVVFARSFPKRADPTTIGESLSGMHAKFCLIVLDESGGMHPALLKTAEQAMTDVEWGLILQAGNPLSKSGALYAVENDPAWRKVRITGDPDDPDRSPRVDIEQARAMIDKYGREDAWVKAYILGQFPNSDLNALLGEDDIRKALGRHLIKTDYSWAQKRIGIDCARFGDDRTVLTPRQGRASFPPVVMRGQDGPAVAGRYVAAKMKFGSECDTIDDTGGWASSVIDFAKQSQNPLIPVNFGGLPDDPRFFNKRAEMYWRAAEWVKSGGALPPEETFRSLGIDIVMEATCATYFLNQKGKLQIEEKDQIKKRIGFSPDYWDSFCLTFANPEAPSGIRAQQIQGATGRMVADLTDDFHPLARSFEKVDTTLPGLHARTHDEI